MRAVRHTVNCLSWSIFFSLIALAIDRLKARNTIERASVESRARIAALRRIQAPYQGVRETELPGRCEDHGEIR